MSGFPRQLPTARTPPSQQAPPLRWGILGSGWIAEQMVTTLHRNTRQVVQAVGSRTAESARAAAQRFGAPTAHPSYAALVADPDVDIIYVTTPHHLHPEHALLAIEAGKHVLVEKPVGLDAADARRIGTAAQRAGVLCMEAMWMFFLPKYDVIRQLLDDGVLGEIQSVVTDFGEWFPTDHRIYDPVVGLGPLLDLGTYNATLITWLLHSPEEIVAQACPAPVPWKVNGQISASARFGSALATLHSTIMAATPTTAVITGTEAVLTIDQFFYRPGSFTLRSHRGELLRHEEPRIDHEGLHYEAAAAARLVAEGATESPLRPWAETVRTMEFLDAIRREVNLDFPEARADRGERP